MDFLPVKSSSVRQAGTVADKLSLDSGCRSPEILIKCPASFSGKKGFMLSAGSHFVSESRGLGLKPDWDFLALRQMLKSLGVNKKTQDINISANILLLGVDRGDWYSFAIRIKHFVSKKPHNYSTCTQVLFWSTIWLLCLSISVFYYFILHLHCIYLIH